MASDDVAQDLVTKQGEPAPKAKAKSTRAAKSSAAKKSASKAAKSAAPATEVAAAGTEEPKVDAAGATIGAETVPNLEANTTGVGTAYAALRYQRRSSGMTSAEVNEIEREERGARRASEAKAAEEAAAANA